MSAECKQRVPDDCACGAPAGDTGYCEEHRVTQAYAAQLRYVQARTACDYALYAWIYLETGRPPLLGTV